MRLPCVVIIPLRLRCLLCGILMLGVLSVPLQYMIKQQTTTDILCQSQESLSKQVPRALDDREKLADTGNTSRVIERNVKRTLTPSNLTHLSQAQLLATKFGLEIVENVIFSEFGPKPTAVPCLGDCQKLAEMLKQWPKSKPKAAFYYLTQRFRLDRLEKSLRLLDENFNAKYQYPIVIFHERDLVPFRSKIQTFIRSTVFFQFINFTMPEFLTHSVHFKIPCLSKVNYRQMCRFHAKEVYEYPIIQGLEYLFRLDDDSFLTGPVRYDVFRYMMNESLAYGYIWSYWDSMPCTEGLWEATRHYINASGITPHFFHKWKRPKIYYNNFEISKTNIWLSKEYKQYVDYLDRLGGIFYHRWGDAPIKSLAVSMFLPENTIHYFKDIGYRHTSFANTGDGPSGKGSQIH